MTQQGIGSRAAIAAGIAAAAGMAGIGGTRAAMDTQPAPNDPTVIGAAKPAARADAAFGVRMFQELATLGPGKNVVCSPESVAEAMGMAFEGAKGATRSEMAKALGLTAFASDADRQAARTALSAALNGPDPEVTLRTANAVWVDRDVHLRPAFAKTAQSAYRASARSLDLSRSPAAAANTINGWVSAKTEKMIPTIVQASDLRGSGAVLTNAVYFHGLWTTPFEKAKTDDKPFHKADGSVLRQVKMMHREAEMGYLKGDGFQAVRLPFGGSAAGGAAAPPPGAGRPAAPRRFAVYVLLPDTAAGLPALVARLPAVLAPPASANLPDWDRRFSSNRVTLSLPRVNASYASSPNLNQPLKRLGIVSAFDPQLADFSALCDKPTFIGQVKHKAVVEMDEEGAKAAAATAVVMTRAVMVPRQPAVVNVDRPFLFLIRDDATGALLFTGAVYDPQAA